VGKILKVGRAGRIVSTLWPLTKKTHKTLHGAQKNAGVWTGYAIQHPLVSALK